MDVDDVNKTIWNSTALEYANSFTWLEQLYTMYTLNQMARMWGQLYSYWRQKLLTKYLAETKREKKRAKTAVKQNIKRPLALYIQSRVCMDVCMDV